MFSFCPKLKRHPFQDASVIGILLPNPSANINRWPKAMSPKSISKQQKTARTHIFFLKANTVMQIKTI